MVWSFGVLHGSAAKADAALLGAEHRVAADYFAGLDKPGVVLIDMQPDFVAGLREHVMARIVHEQLRVLEECARLDIPVVVLEYKGHGATIPKLATALKHVPRRSLIRKTNDDGFYKTHLKGTLTGFDVRSPLLMGINAHACVLKTAESGLDYGFVVKTSEHLIADRGRSGIFYDAKRWYEVNGCLLEAPG